MTVAASALLALLGAVVLGWALLGQHGAPPVPRDGAGVSAGAPDDPQRTELTATTGGGDVGIAAAASGDAGTATAPGGDVGTATAGPAAAPTAEPAAPTADPTPYAEAMPPSEPVSITIPAIDVTSELHPLGLDAAGKLEVPSGDRYDQAAWYDGSATPGEIGPSVIEGHVTSQGSVPSVFFELGALEPGDTIEVTRADDSVAVFEVYALDSFPKDEFPRVTVYGNTEGPELRLITCGGEYDPQGRRHLDNIVVFARLIEQA